MITITFPDGAKKTYDRGSTPEDIARSIAPGLAKRSVAARFDNELYDMDRPLEQSGTLTLITKDSPEALDILNHSTAHLMAHAVKRLHPDARFGVGPAIKDGFYYDIDTKHVIREDDLPRIEEEMRKIAAEGVAIERKEMSKDAARAWFKDDAYKLELLDDIDDEETISVYVQGDFSDLCRGGHLRDTKAIRHFKLLSIAGAYWRGSSDNVMLQRVYGCSFYSDDDLQNHLAVLKDRKERDHRKLGKELKIFTLDNDAGQGLVLWLPNGYAVRKVLEDYVYKLERKAGYMHLSTPVLGTKRLYEVSGHFDHYQDDMFPLMESDHESFVLRPMSCPHHAIVYRSELRSYRDLPLRYAEMVTQHRYEASGALSGLERVRAMTLTDAHIFVRPDQIKEEVLAAYRLILRAIEDLKLTVDYVELALRDGEKGKFHDNDALWNEAEKALKNVLVEESIEHTEVRGEAAFYGPKIDFQVRTAMDRVITMSTVQLDFLLPERFDLNYIGEDGGKHRPVLIHRGLISTWERLMSILLEQYKGAFPLWLAPVQVKIIPVSPAVHGEVAERLHQRLLDHDFRSEVDRREEKLGYRIREAQTQKVPYQVVIGDQEVADDTVTLRRYGEREQTTLSSEDFFTKLKEESDAKV